MGSFAESPIGRLTGPAMVSSVTLTLRGVELAKLQPTWRKPADGTRS